MVAVLVPTVAGLKVTVKVVEPLAATLAAGTVENEKSAAFVPVIDTPEIVNAPVPML